MGDISPNKKASLEATATAKSSDAYASRHEQQKTKMMSGVKTAITRSVNDSAMEGRKVLYEEIMVCTSYFLGLDLYNDILRSEPNVDLFMTLVYLWSST